MVNINHYVYYVSTLISADLFYFNLNPKLKETKFQGSSNMSVDLV